MRKSILAVAALAAFGLPAHAEYVKGQVSQARKDEAYCNSVATRAERGYFAFGNSTYVAGAAIGSAIGNIVRVSEAKRNCMTMLGYEWKKPKRAARAAGSGSPLFTPSAAD